MPPTVHLARAPGAAVTYVPLEEMLRRPRIRLLRALRWMDWIEPTDLFDALGLVETASDDNRDRDRHSRGLASLLAAGAVEQRRVPQPSKARGAGRKVVERVEYRVTQRGRSMLRAEIDGYRARLGEGCAA